MPTAFDKLAFEAAQAARVGWFFGQKLLAARMSKPLPVPEKLRGRKMPDRQRLLRDLWRSLRVAGPAPRVGVGPHRWGPDEQPKGKPAADLSKL